MAAAAAAVAKGLVVRLAGRAAVGGTPAPGSSGDPAADSPAIKNHL